MVLIGPSSLEGLMQTLQPKQQKEGATRTKATLSLYEIAGQHLTKYFHDLFKQLKCWDLVLCNKVDYEVDRSHFRGNSSDVELPRSLCNKMILLES